MTVTHNDCYQLTQDVTFQNRVQAALTAACVSIANEGWAVPFHRERATFAAQILSTFGGSTNYVILFTNAVSTDTNVIGDATQAGTVPLTSGNRAAQAALVTDAHIDAAISAEFNAFIRVPAN
jgi:hypothetical protein